MDGLELICFKILSASGDAKSCYMEGVKLAREGNFDLAKAKIEEGRTAYIQGHKAHAELIQEEASGKGVPSTLLLLHAEDQMMAADVIKLMAEEFIANYQRIAALEANQKENV